MTCNFNESGDFNTQQLSQIENSQMAMDLFGTPNDKLSNGNNLRFNNKGSISVDLATGRYYDFADGSGGYLVNEFKRKNNLKTSQELIEALGLIEQQFESNNETDNQKSNKISSTLKMAWIESTWNNSFELVGSPAFTYLNKYRNIPEYLLNECTSLRYAECEIPYNFDGRKFPAMIAKITDCFHNFKGLHITYIKSDGMGKNFNNSKRIVGSNLKGCFINLGNDNRDVVVAEGIESALSVAVYYNRTPISALNISGLKSWHPSTGVNSILYAPDLDKNGIGFKAAQTSASNLYTKGFLIAGFIYATAGYKDFNELLMADVNNGGLI